METAVKFFNAYLDIDYAGNVAVFSESDEVVNELRDASMKFWHAAPGVLLSPGFGRPMGMPPEQLARLAANTDPARRTLFLVATHHDPTWGDLYAGYVGGDREQSAKSYGRLLYATGIENEFKLIAAYREDFDKVSPPVRWRHSQGVEISSRDAPTAVRPLEVPSGRAAHRQDWEMLRNAATEG